MASGCQICAQTGQCNAAFHNGPGQYCGVFSDPNTSINKPCCCPLQATCKVSPFACKCHVSDHQTPASNGYYPQPTTHHYPQQYHHRSPISSLIITLLFFLGCFWCCCRRRDDRGHYEHVPAVPVASAVPATCPPSENPQYHPVPVPAYGVGGGGGGGGGTGTAIASGLGGLAAGTFIGDMLGRNNAQANNQGGFGAGWGGGGGGGYDIVGDSGGGGYDIAGDTGGGGGGGDFAGDS